MQGKLELELGLWQWTSFKEKKETELETQALTASASAWSSGNTLPRGTIQLSVESCYNPQKLLTINSCQCPRETAVWNFCQEESIKMTKASYLLVTVFCHKCNLFSLCPLGPHWATSVKAHREPQSLDEGIVFLFSPWGWRGSWHSSLHGCHTQQPKPNAQGCIKIVCGCIMAVIPELGAGGGGEDRKIRSSRSPWLHWEL